MVQPDMLPNSFALGYDSIEEFIHDVLDYGSDCIDFDHEHTKQLLVGAIIVSEIRAAVFRETGNIICLPCKDVPAPTR